ncbi:MAG: PLD nuclease N-terminal domain-containing protein, partial [Methanosarcinales archaeon]
YQSPIFTFFMSKFSKLALGQPLQPPTREEEALCGLCGLFVGAFILIPIILFIISIALLVWVARDAKNKGMDNPALWMIIVFFLNIIGLIIYLLSRPSGKLVQCEHCKNRKLESLKTCPHCGHTVD